MRDFEVICERMKANGMMLPSDREILRLSDAGFLAVFLGAEGDESRVATPVR